MIYLIVNIILIVIFVLIALSADTGGFFGAFAIYALIGYGLMVAPIIIAVVNLIVVLFLGDYSYIKFALIPLLIPISVYTYETLQQYIYSRVYYKYSDIVIEKAFEYFKERNIDIEKENIWISFNRDDFCKKNNNKRPCTLHVKAKGDIHNIYGRDLMEDVQKHLDDCVPDLKFKASYS